MRAQLLIGLDHWLEKRRMTQAEAAKVLGVTQARAWDRERGKIVRFNTDLLVRDGQEFGRVARTLGLGLPPQPV